MKIAVIADIHSNIHGLDAIWDDIADEKPDVVVGAGDMVGCSAYPAALDVWNILQNMGIPCVLGNEEDRILRFYDPLADPHLKNSIQFGPLRYRARQFSANDIELMKTLPATILLDGPDKQNVLVCHASPGNIHRSPMQGIDSQMEEDLRQTQAKVIVVGHLHAIWHQYWQGKLLVMAGSGGLPLREKLDEVDYLILTYHKQEWRFEYKTVKYDYQAAVRAVIESDFLEQAGPIGWLMFDEILTQEDRLVPFLGEYCPPERPDDMANWKRLAIGYLEHIQRWDVVKLYVQRFL
jgi:predicted phosphodiesterase